MPLDLKKPILYLITGGATTSNSTPESKEFQDILKLISRAVDLRVPLVQLREKDLSARSLFELAERAAQMTRGTETHVLVNDRADIAAAAGADGVHLTTRSLAAHIIRRTFGENFLIGASTHSPAEATAARDDGADFAVFGPIFQTASKINYGSPLGLESLAEVSSKLTPFPILALGGVSQQNALECLQAGATGLAGISLFLSEAALQSAVAALR